MSTKFPYMICCPCCGHPLSKSYEGTKSFIHCPKCRAEWYYEVRESGTTIKILKEPKSLPEVPEVPA